MEKECPLIFVGQLSKLTGKTPRALRMYEDLGLLSPAGRTSSGYRRYDQKSIDQVTYIEQLQLMGLTLTEIQKWVQDFRIKVDVERSGRDVMLILRELYVQKQLELQQKILELQKINEQLQSATHFLQGCSTCLQQDVPTSCVTCKEQDMTYNKNTFETDNSLEPVNEKIQIHTAQTQKNQTQKTQNIKHKHVPELVFGMLSMIQPF
jgi:DNA-binding transcriptional MerR regulator